MRYMEKIIRERKESAGATLAAACNELSGELTELVGKWAANGDLPILLAGVRKMIPLIENAAGEAGCELAHELEKRMGAESVIITEPRKK